MYVHGDITNYGARFDELTDTVMLQKAEYYARWTIPHLMGQVQTSGMQYPIEGDFQSGGALLVNSLSSKLANLLFPTTQPFMTINITPEGRMALEEAVEESGGDPDTITNFLGTLASDASSKAFSGRSFFQLVLAFKYLIITGNVGIYRSEEHGSITCYGPRSFVTRRDGIGRVVEAIIKENIYFKELPEDIKDILVSNGGYDREHDERDRVVTKYTRLLLNGPYYEESLGIDDIILGDEFKVEYEILKTPYLFPTWSLINGEHYGRGLVEELSGDFAKFSALSESLTLYELEMSRLINIVSAESFDAIDELAVADTGSYVRASPTAVLAYESGSTDKVQQILADLEVVWGRLTRAMMWRGNTREGERVTAYEIQQEIQEVEASMGGAYSALAESLQLPLSYLFLYEVDTTFMDALMDVDAGHVDITTGLNALGQTSKAMQLLETLQQAAQAVQMSQVDQRIDPKKIVDLFFAAKGLDFKELSKSDEQLEEEALAAEERAEAEGLMDQAEGVAAEASQMGLEGMEG